MASLLREYLWLWVVLLVLFSSGIIVLLFICLNRWIRRQGKLNVRLDEKRTPSTSERYQSPVRQNVSRVVSPGLKSPGLDLSSPPLPPRTQFMDKAPVDVSYENLADGSDYENPDEKSDHSYEVADCRTLPEYLALESGPAPCSYQKEDVAEEKEEQRNSDYEDIAEEKEEQMNSDYEDVAEDEEEQRNSDYEDVAEDEEEQRNSDYEDVAEDEEEQRNSDYDDITAAEEQSNSDYENAAGDKKEEEDEDYDDVV